MVVARAILPRLSDEMKDEILTHRMVDIALEAEKWMRDDATKNVN
jgi:hypothetical protein